ncbi:putative reverse transcriptase domain-containing protein [Tanacetum coccineum]|uniref:Reverse transcriptase domain-containing protein n=1 Tax=Tanacetum coccineum TaxID=301880 RepID=A0ABQ4WVD8_9ASTR
MPLTKLGPSVPSATPTIHPEGFVAHASTVTARVIWQRIVEASACPRLNLAQGPEENRPNQVAANNEGRGHGNQGNQARGRAFTLGAEETRKDPNIVTKIEGHVFNIDLIPFGHGSFDVIIVMDWLSNYKAEIICHEKVVRIPLSDGKVLRVLGKRPEEKVRLLMSAKANEKKQEEIVVDSDFPEVFLDDLSRLPPTREIEFQIELILRSTPVAKSPYRLTPYLKLESFRDNSRNPKTKVFIDQDRPPWERRVYRRYLNLLYDSRGARRTLMFLGHVINGDGIYVDPSKIEAVKNWKAPRTPTEVCSLLGLVGYYRRLIENFSKIAKNLTILTRKCKTFNWGEEQELAFQTLKDKLCNAPVLALPDGP